MDDSLQNSDQTSNGGGTEVCLPLDAVKIEDASPAEGDEVEVFMKATVTRVENDMVYATPTTFNDVPAPDHQDDQSEEDQLRQGMNQMTTDGGYGSQHHNI